MRAAIVRGESVVNVVEVPDGWTGVGGEWKPPNGTEAILSETAKVGDGYVGQSFTTPKSPVPDYSSEDWYRMIRSRADTELQRGVSVTIDGTTYGIRTGPQALALIDGAAIRADVSKRNGQQIERLVQTDQGMLRFDQDALWQIFEAVESHQQAVSERAETLQWMVADGTIDQDALDGGWP